VSASGLVHAHFATEDGADIAYRIRRGRDPLVLIHGLGDNPHAFDDLAGVLKSDFHIVAYARRGHGQSTQNGPFDTPTFVRDLSAVMDTLGIAKAHLAGWSMGGNEITAMAGVHPDRVGKIVYLDAGFDWADPAFGAAAQEFPLGFTAPPEALTSLDAFRRWEVANWFPAVTDTSRIEAYMRALVTLDSSGKAIPVVSDSVSNLLFTSLTTYGREYKKVKVPALAIYAASFLDGTNRDSASAVTANAWEAKHMVPFRNASKARITREVKSIDTLTVPGTHADFMFTSRDAVVAAMNRLLKAP